MPLIFYSIAQYGDSWSIALNGDHIETCQALETAVTASIRAAAAGQKKGYDSQVILCDKGEDHVLWSNGRLIGEDQPDAIAA